MLKYLFPVPKDDSKRVITFANEEDYISFRYTMCISWGGYMLSTFLLQHTLIKIVMQVFQEPCTHLMVSDNNIREKATQNELFV